MTSTDGDGTSMEEEQLNEIIRRRLAASRKPPEPPLDEMWANIESRAFGAAPRRVMPAQWSRIATPALAAAAAMLIGVGLGWYIAPRGGVVTRFVTSPAQSVATNQRAIAARSDDSLDAQDRARTTSMASSQAQQLQAHAETALEPHEQSRQNMTTARLASRFDDAGGSDMSRYLIRTAALLASLPSDRTTMASDSSIAIRAGELLTQTHLLLDSKAGSDPTLHKLLEDLELVLAQIARLRIQRDGSDLQLIHQALTVRDVLPRVHDATVEASITD